MEALEAGVASPSWTEWNELNVTLGEYVSAAGTGVMEPQAALDECVEQWNSVLSEAGLLYEE